MASNQNLEFIISVAAQQGLKSLQDVEKEIKAVTLAFKEATTQVERMAQATRLQQLGGFKTAMMGATSAIQGTQTASANASMALLNLNYVIRDSPYFFNNFALGLLAVGNNINPLIDSFARLRKEAGEKTISTFALLKQAMVGGAGISIAFSLVVTAIQSYVFWMSRNREETEKAKKETVDLEEQLRVLKGTMEDIGEVNANFVSLKVQELSFVDQQVESYKNLIARYQEHGASQDAINRANEHLQGWLNLQTSLNKEIDAGNKFSAKNIELMKGLAGATLKGKDAITAFAKENKLSQGQLDGIIKLWQQYGKEIASVGGGLAGELPQGMREIALQLGIQDSELQKILKVFEEMRKKIKEIKRELLEAGDASKRFLREMANYPGQGFGREATTTESTARIGGTFGADARPSRFLGAMGQKMKESMKEFQLQLEMGKILANELGDALNQAFMKGKFALDEFIKSLISAIAQMLILRAVTSFFTLGLGGAASAMPLAPASPVPGVLGGFGKIGIDINGKIEAKQDKFVIDFKRAESRMRVLQT